MIQDSSIAFTLSASVEGGCKRFPGVMCSESRDAVIAAKNRVIVYLQQTDRISERVRSHIPTDQIFCGVLHQLTI